MKERNGFPSIADKGTKTPYCWLRDRTPLLPGRGRERERDLFQGIGSLVGKAGEFKICRVGQQAGDPEQN